MKCAHAGGPLPLPSRLYSSALMNNVEEGLSLLFQERFSEAPESITPLPTDGSSRRYFRLIKNSRTAVGALGPDRKENEAFLGFSRHFRQAGLPVPEIYAQDLGHGLYLEEDLGDVTLFKFLSEKRIPGAVSSSVIEAYEKVIRLLPEFQIKAGKNLDWNLCYPRSRFDRQSMLWDCNHFKYYFLQLAKIPFHEQALEDDFNRFVDFLAGAGQEFFLYRDFQSRNIMMRGGSPWFIDYQGGRKGSLQYDVASLLYDAKADLPQELREHLLNLYLEAAGALTPIKRNEFIRLYSGFVYIRIMQAMGAYGLRGFYERKSHFLQSIPYAIQNLEYLLRHEEFPVKAPELTGALRRLTTSSYLRQFGQVHLKLTVRVESFSYKTGIPMDQTGHGGGFVFDCRCLDNPGKYKEYEQLSGADAPVITFLEQNAGVQRFLTHVQSLIGQAIVEYQGRNFTELTIAFGCTGGRHRSVYCAERLSDYLKKRHKVDVELTHRSLQTTAGDPPAAGQRTRNSADE